MGTLRIKTLNTINIKDEGNVVLVGTRTCGYLLVQFAAIKIRTHTSLTALNAEELC